MKRVSIDKLCIGGGYISEAQTGVMKHRVRCNEAQSEAQSGV